nr:EOG090X04Z9 [Cyclestheria hislopi]
MKAANSVSNMSLAHEITVDNDFHLQKLELPDNSLHHVVKEMMHKAFWDVLREELNQKPPEYNRALTLLAEVKEWLLSLLLPHQTRTQQEIKEKLDIDLIQQQAEEETLDFRQYSQYIISLMARLCAPSRDEKIRELTALSDIVDIFKGIFETLELMKLDMANFTIRQIRPQIAACSVEYERNKFEEYLKVTPDGLRNTREWLYRNRSVQSASAASSSTDTLHGISSILISSFMELLKWDETNPWPETVAMDEGRFAELRNKLASLEILSSVALVTFSQNIGSLQTSTDFRKIFKEHVTVVLGQARTAEELKEVLPNVIVQVFKDVNEGLKNQDTDELNSESKEFITGQIMELRYPTSRIRQLLHSRILDFLQRVISSDTAQPTQIPAGLSLFREELALIAGQFARLVSHNRAVFAHHYADLIQKHCLE